MVDDFDKYTKENFTKNGAKEIVRVVGLIKAKNWIKNMETTFKTM